MFTGFWLVLEWSWYISCMMQVYANCTNKKFHAHTCRILKNLGISRKDTAFSGFLWIPNFRPLHNRCNHVNIIYIYTHISCIWTLEKFTQIIPLHAAGFRTLVMFTLFVHTTISLCFSHKGVGSLLWYLVFQDPFDLVWTSLIMFVLPLLCLHVS